jgi:hypothetical protein
MPDSLSPSAFSLIMLMSPAVLAPELLVTFGLWFAPGWANWGGRTIPWVWPAGMAVCLFLLMATFGCGTAGLIGLALSLSRQRKQTRRVVVGRLVLWAGIATVSTLEQHRNRKLE